MINLKSSRFVYLCCLIIGAVIVFSFNSFAEEETRHMLLETAAKYQVEYEFLNQLEIVPPTLSIQTRGSEGIVSKFSRLYGGLPHSNQWTYASLVFTTPEGAKEASISLDSNIGYNTGFSIVRLNNLKPSPNELVNLIVNEELYTGLIVDARGLEVERGISPRIWSESGDLVYGGVAATYELIQAQGVISYGQNISSDLINRVSIPGKLTYSAPLVVDAIGVTERTNTGVIISNESADLIFAAIANYDFLSEYAVVILLD